MLEAELLQEHHLRRGDIFISSLWGFAEATLFFIVPDVFLTKVALDSFPRALKCCLFATLGAAIGGVVMYSWGHDPNDAARNFLFLIPGIDSETVSHVRLDLKASPFLAFFQGIFGARPYKIYAIFAEQSGITLLPFIAVSLGARFFRFALTSGLASFIAYIIPLDLSRPMLLGLHFSFWVTFYAIYFAIFGW